MPPPLIAWIMESSVCSNLVCGSIHHGYVWFEGDFARIVFRYIPRGVWSSHCGDLSDFSVFFSEDHLDLVSPRLVANGFKMALSLVI